MEKAFQVSQCTEKSFPSFPFQSSNKNSKFLVIFHFMKLIASKLGQ